mgnify:CR=1 FL=1
MRYLIGSILCSIYLFAQSETLTIDAQNFEIISTASLSTELPAAR